MSAPPSLLRDDGLDQEALTEIGRIVVEAINASSSFRIVRRPATSAAPLQPTPRMLSAIWDRVEGSTNAINRTSSPVPRPAPTVQAAPTAHAAHRSQNEPTTASFLSHSTKAMVDRQRRAQAEAHKMAQRVIKLKNDEIIFLPERLLNQKVQLKDHALMSLLSKRGCRAVVKIPWLPGTSASIIEHVTKTFRENDPPVDLDQYGIQFARFTQGDVLVPLNISIDNINAETLQDTYSKRICVIVPTVDKFDPDFHRFRREFDSEGLSNKSSESVKAISPPPRPLPRPFASRKGNKANPAPPPRPPPPPSPSPPVVSETPEYERFCFCCAAPFERAPDEATCEEWYAELEEQHMRTCPRQSACKITFASEIGGGFVPAWMQFWDAGIDGVHQYWYPYLHAQAKQYMDDSKADGPDWAQEGHINFPSGCHCGRPDNFDSEMVQCEACPHEHWFHSQCVRYTQGDKRWRCPECIKHKRPFWSVSPEGPSKRALEKQRQRSLPDSPTPAACEVSEPSAKRARPHPEHSAPLRRSSRNPSPSKPT